MEAIQFVVFYFVAPGIVFTIPSPPVRPQIDAALRDATERINILSARSKHPWTSSNTIMINDGKNSQTEYNLSNSDLDQILEIYPRPQLKCGAFQMSAKNSTLPHSTIRDFYEPRSSIFMFPPLLLFSIFLSFVIVAYVAGLRGWWRCVRIRLRVFVRVVNVENG